MALEKFGKMIGNIASTTAKKAGEQAQIAKLGIDRAGVEKQIEGVYTAMGRYCYSRVKAGDSLPEELLEYCRDIDTLLEQKSRLESEISAHKTERDAAEYTVSEDFRNLKSRPKDEYISTDISLEDEPAPASAAEDEPFIEAETEI